MYKQSTIQLISALPNFFQLTKGMVSRGNIQKLIPQSIHADIPAVSFPAPLECVIICT